MGSDLELPTVSPTEPGGGGTAGEANRGAVSLYEVSLHEKCLITLKNTSPLSSERPGNSHPHNGLLTKGSSLGEENVAECVVSVRGAPLPSLRAPRS